MRKLPILMAFTALAGVAAHGADAGDVLDRLLNRDAAEDGLWATGFDGFDARPTQGTASVEGGVLRVDSDASEEQRLVVGQVSVRAIRSAHQSVPVPDCSSSRREWRDLLRPPHRPRRCR
jgi:hypothetical protein